MLPPLQFLPLGWRMQAERTVVAGVGSVSHVDAHSCSGLAVQVYHCLRPGVACGHAQPWYLCYSSSTCCNTYTLTRTHACMHTNIYIYNKGNNASSFVVRNLQGKMANEATSSRQKNGVALECAVHSLPQHHPLRNGAITWLRARESPKQAPAIRGRQTVVQWSAVLARFVARA